MMPDMDGIETLHHIKQSSINTDTLTVVLTANAISGARQMYLDEGFDAYLSKPVDGEKLEKLLYDMLPDDIINEFDPDDEKVRSGEQRTLTQNDERSADEIISKLYDISELDVDDGIVNGGGKEGYISILTVFYKTAVAKADEIEALYDDKDIKDYTIKVHALKSSARIVGAKEISELAKSLEDAGNAGNMSYIDEHTEKLLRLYRDLESRLKPILSFEEEPDIDKLELGKQEMKEAYQTIIEIASGMDFDLMDELLKDIDSYSLKKEDDDRIQRIKKLLLEMDWDEIKHIAKEGYSNV